LTEDSIEELRFKVIKKMLTDFPELRERTAKYLQENENKE